MSFVVYRIAYTNITSLAQGCKPQFVRIDAIFIRAYNRTQIYRGANLCVLELTRG